MPLMHRTIYHSQDGPALMDTTDAVFLEWLGSRGRGSDQIDLDRIGREGNYAEVGANFRARIDSLESSEETANRYSAIAVSDHGTYSTHMTTVRDGAGAWVQLDIHAPHQNSMFHAPKIPSLLVDRATEIGLHLTTGHPAERFTPAPRRVKVDEVGELLDLVINNEHRRTTALVAGIRREDNYDSWSGLFEQWFSLSQGVATLWLLDSQATDEFNSLVEQEYQVYPRSIHSFQPMADTDDPEDARRHRWFSAHDLQENTGTKRNQSRLYHLSRITALKQKAPQVIIDAERQLASQATKLQLHQGTENSPFQDRIRNLRSTWPILPDSAPATTQADTPTPVQEPVSKPATPKPAPPVTRHHAPVLPPRSKPTPPAPPAPKPTPARSPDIPREDASVGRIKQIEAMVREFCGTIDLTPDEDLSLDDLMLEVFDRFWKGNKAVQNAERILAEKVQEITELEDDNSVLQQAWDEAIEDNGALNVEFAESQRRIQFYSRQLQELSAPPSAYELPEFEAPNSVVTVLAWLKKKKLPHVIFTGDEKKAKDLDHRPNSESIARICWDFLVTLNDYARQCTTGHTSVRTYIDNEETTAHRSKFASSETNAVKGNDIFRNARTLRVPTSINEEGRIPMYAHYRLANDGGKSPRLHYHDATRQDGKIYVGYIGEHLPSPMTT